MSTLLALASWLGLGIPTAAVLWHRGQREPSRRLRSMLAAEDAGGSNRLSTYRDFERRIRQIKTQNVAYLDRVKRAGKTVFGFGAPVKGNTLLNYFGIGPRYLDCLVEINELRRGLYSPGMHIPVVMEKELDEPPDVYYVLAWNFKDEILAKNSALIDAGVEFHFPVDPDVGWPA